MWYNKILILMPIMIQNGSFTYKANLNQTKSSPKFKVTQNFYYYISVKVKYDSLQVFHCVNYNSCVYYKIIILQINLNQITHAAKRKPVACAAVPSSKPTHLSSSSLTSCSSLLESVRSVKVVWASSKSLLTVRRSLLSDSKHCEDSRYSYFVERTVSYKIIKV